MDTNETKNLDPMHREFPPAIRLNRHVQTLIAMLDSVQAHLTPTTIEVCRNIAREVGSVSFAPAPVVPAREPHKVFISIRPVMSRAACYPVPNRYAADIVVRGTGGEIYKTKTCDTRERAIELAERAIARNGWINTTGKGA